MQLQGQAVYALRVTYDESVGKDTWYFYLDRKTCALVGHRFYHDEAVGDGEYAVLSEEVSGSRTKAAPREEVVRGTKTIRFVITHTILSILPHCDAAHGRCAQELSGC